MAHLSMSVLVSPVMVSMSRMPFMYMHMLVMVNSHLAERDQKVAPGQCGLLFPWRELTMCRFFLCLP